MKWIYKYDEHNDFVRADLRKDDYVLQDNETDIPRTKIGANHFTGTEWVPSEDPKSKPKQPSPEQQMIMQQQTQLAQLSQAKTQLQNLAMKQQTALTQTQQLLMQQQLQLAQLKGSK